MYFIEFKICVVVGNGSHVVVTYQIFPSYVDSMITNRKQTVNNFGKF